MAKPAQPRGTAKAAPRKPAASTAKSAAPAQSNRERPDEPERYKASKAEMLEFYRQMMLICQRENKAALRGGKRAWQHNQATGGFAGKDFDDAADISGIARGRSDEM